nr:hypothetical protein Iba_chr14dCG3750 [Ipomoea batatas]
MGPQKALVVQWKAARRRDRPPTADVREAKATESVSRALVREATTRVRACEEGQEADCRERLATGVVAVLTEQAGAGGGQGVTASSAERHSRFRLAFSNFGQEASTATITCRRRCLPACPFSPEKGERDRTTEGDSPSLLLADEGTATPERGPAATTSREEDQSSPDVLPSHPLEQRMPERS